MLIMRSRKFQITQVTKLSSQERIRSLREKEIYKYLRILKVDTIKQKKEMKEKIRKKADEREKFSELS